MAGPDFARGGAAIRCAVAGSVLLLVTGCTTLAPPSGSARPTGSPAVAKSAPASAAAPASAPASAVEAGAASEPAAEAPPPSRLTALAKRLLNKLRKPAVPAPDPAAEPEPAQPPEKVVDEKYRLTGEAALELERGRASWYGARFHGQPTASGEPYDKYALTAAHKTLPFGTIVRVRSLALGREVDVRINDRGPFTPGRVIDVSQAAAEALGLTGAGVAEVSLKVAESQLEGAAAAQPQGKARSSPQAGSRNAKGKKPDSKVKNAKGIKASRSAKSPSVKAKPRSSTPKKAR